MSKNSVHEEIYRGCKIRLETDDDPADPREWDNIGRLVCWHNRYTLGDEQPKIDQADFLRLRGLEQAGKEISALERRTNTALRRIRDWDYVWNRAVHAAFEDRQEKLVEKVIDTKFVILPVFLYDHSGITMSTGAFSCKWDSGQVGFIYCTLEKAQHEWGTPDSAVRGWDGDASYSLKEDGSKHTLREAATNYMTGEVEQYDSYLTGDVVGVVAEDPDGGHIESCWGFYPDKGDYSKRWDYPIGEAKSYIDYWCKQQEKEKAEAAYWACRDTVTA